MFGWNRPKQKLSRQLDALAEQMNVLSAHIAQLAEERRQATSVTISHLEVEQAFLDELTFRLDSLDIEELSGSLNLGNNFHPKVTHTAAKSNQAGTGPGPQMWPKDATGSPPETSVIGRLTDGRQMASTTNGYSITLS